MRFRGRADRVFSASTFENAFPIEMNTFVNGATGGSTGIFCACAQMAVSASSAPVAAIRGQWRMTRMYTLLDFSDRKRLI